MMDLQGIKRQFMAYRNGIVSDTLRRAGMDCYKVIFGLNVPQLACIAGTLEQSMELADTLWADSGVRESRLLAAYIFPPGDMTEEMALRLMAETQTQEEADMLAFRLLRRLPFLDRLKGQAAGFAAVALARY